MLIDAIVHGERACPFTVDLGNRASVSLIHVANDPEGVYRLYIKKNDCCLELCPSKGLSVRDTTLAGRSIVGEPPLEDLPDPRKIDLDGEMIYNGKIISGLNWIRYFAASIEMLGLIHWGMNKKDSEGKLLVLHGNASLIPIEKAIIQISEDIIEVKGEYYIYNANDIYKQGIEKPIYKVNKSIQLLTSKNALLLIDTITNETSDALIPDWGYHIQLRPEPKCKLLFPKSDKKLRGGGQLPTDYNEWNPGDPAKRTEKGLIYKNIPITSTFPDGQPACEALLEYENSTGTRCLYTPAPYTLGWYSCGGSESDEFLDLDGRRIFTKNWDGVGPEIGASDLDNNGEVSENIEVRELASGESMKLQIYVEPIDAVEVKGVKLRFEL